MKIEKQCLNCGRKFTVLYKRRNQKFCSSECYRKNRIGKKGTTWSQVNKICIGCGKEYKTYKSLDHRSKYCSMECYKSKVYSKIIRHCLNCGYEYLIKKNKDKLNKFCSKRCQYQYQKGELSPLYVRIEKKCIECGKIYKVWKCKEQESKYCSKECFIKHTMKIKICIQCGKEFHIVGRKGRSKNICSRECLAKLKPNLSEIKLDNIIHELNLPYKFVGNGGFEIERLRPDFINVNGQKKIIELFGEYWHNKPGMAYSRTEIGRREVFKKYGYDMLVIWYKELKDTEQVKQKLMAFDNQIHL